MIAKNQIMIPFQKNIKQGREDSLKSLPDLQIFFHSPQNLRMNLFDFVIDKCPFVAPISKPYRDRPLVCRKPFPLVNVYKLNTTQRINFLMDDRIPNGGE